MKSYRCYKASSPMSDWGHAMFADNPESIDGGYGWGDYTWYTVDEFDLTSIEDLTDAIIAAMNSLELDIDQDELLSLLDPEDIVMSAEGYDSDDIVPWFWEAVCEPLGIKGVKTMDGAVVFDEEIIHRTDKESVFDEWYN